MRSITAGGDPVRISSLLEKTLTDSSEVCEN
jgi:hypothetical protein